ncbi:hypothetical protein IIO_04720 [Bacillus cereus VD115]|nr:hypothetical protein IIO_04720 [Bacillus cereus VD115]
MLLGHLFLFLLIPGACSFFRSAFVHYAVDWDKKVSIVSIKYRAWGTGPAANARFVHVELCETIDGKLNVDDSLQFKVHNSIGKTYYITINEVYVYVR